MKVRSMTGFARVRETIAGIDVVLSVKSVNHRGLDIHFYVGSEMDPLENAMRAAVKRHMGRGHVDIRVQLAPGEGSANIGLDAARLEGYMTAFRRASERYGLAGAPDLNTAFRIPGMLTDTAVIELPEAFELPFIALPFIALLERALGILNQFREREGIETAGVMLERNAAIHAGALRMEGLREQAVPAFQNRLRDRLIELLGNGNIDPQRLAQEAAMLADRGDIGEEISRLKIHARQVDELLRTGTEVGKKLDFLLQEMNRETNTILSKTAGVGEPGLSITELALSAKSDIEKIREQSLNLE
jgi:uncharacterized protein (TIGR00255 family)